MKLKDVLPSSPRARGRSAQRQGASFEAQILGDAARAGWLLVHVPPPVQILRPLDGSGSRLVVCRLESPVAADFLGVLPCGRAVAIEAKSAAWDAHPTSFPLPERLRGHQGDFLRSVAARGGLALVLLRRVSGSGSGLERDGEALYAIPWPEGDPRGADGMGRVSWAWEAIERWRVGRGEEWTWRGKGLS